MPSKKTITLIIFGLIGLAPVVTWIINRGWQGELVYGLARLAALLAFTGMFLQLLTGALAKYIRPLVGPKVQLNLHIWTGIISFILAWVHPLLMVVSLGFSFVWWAGGDLWIGKLALTLLHLSVLAGLARTATWLAPHWRWVHRLNYVIFALVWWHSWKLGSDIGTFPMNLIHGPAIAVLAISLLLKSINGFKNLKLKNWKLNEN